MKKYLATAFCAAIGFGAFAQNETPKSTFSLVDKSDLKSKSWSRLSGVDLGFSQMISDDNSEDIIAGKSLYWGFNPFNYFGEIGSGKQGFETGLGFFFQSRTFDSTQPTNFSAAEIADPDVEKFKQKYRSFGIQVPALFTFNLGDTKDKSFFISAGVMGKYYLTTSYKEKLFFEDKKDKKIKDSGVFGLNQLQADLTVRLGTPKFAIFGQYGLTSFYKDTDANILTFGIAGLF